MGELSREPGGGGAVEWAATRWAAATRGGGGAPSVLNGSWAPPAMVRSSVTWRSALYLAFSMAFGHTVFAALLLGPSPAQAENVELRRRTEHLRASRARGVDAAEFERRRIAAGGTVIDPEVIGQLLGRRRTGDPLESLTPREREVLGLMAQGRSNGAIAEDLVVTEGAVEKHISNIFMKLGLQPAQGGHRRVMAVLAYLGRAGGRPPDGRRRSGIGNAR